MYIILVDMRENNGQVVAIQDDNDGIAQVTKDKVDELLQEHILC